MKTNKVIFSLFLLTLLIVFSCKKNKKSVDYAANASCGSTVPTYTNDVKLILDQSCATSGCHSSASAKQGIKLHDYSNASSQFKSNSKNLGSVHHESGIVAMPKGGSKLSNEVINKLDCWVKNGCLQ